MQRGLSKIRLSENVLTRITELCLFAAFDTVFYRGRFNVVQVREVVTDRREYKVTMKELLNHNSVLDNVWVFWFLTRTTFRCYCCRC